MDKIPINPEQEYSPREIAKNGWIRNTKNNPDYFFVLKLIKLGRLRARNVCLASQKYFRVLGQSIIDYRNDIKNAYNDSTDTEPKPENAGQGVLS